MARKYDSLLMNQKQILAVEMKFLRRPPRKCRFKHIRNDVIRKLKGSTHKNWWNRNTTIIVWINETNVSRKKILEWYLQWRGKVDDHALFSRINTNMCSLHLCFQGFLLFVQYFYYEMHFISSINSGYIFGLYR